MSTLTERYVHAATRFISDENERTELGLEISERIDDTAAALTSGGLDPAAAERQALIELGDPLLLSAEYRQRPTHLIGPRFLYTYWRLLGIIMATTVPIVAVLAGLGEASAAGTAGDIVAAALAAALSTAVHVGFWTTVLFAVLERVTSGKVGEWTPDMLPATAGGSTRRGDLVAQCIMLAILAIALVWQHIGSPVIGSDGRIPLVNPDLWVPWTLLVVGLLVVEAAHAAWVYRGGWTRPTAIANAIIAVAFAAVTVPLLWQQLVVNPALVEHLGWVGGTAVGEQIAAVAVVGLTVWAIIDGFRKAARARAGAVR